MKLIKVYNLLNAKGDKLTLRLGYDPALCGTTGDNDCGMRWSFEGKCIPMPTRGWFNGFPEETMLNWLNENGWVARCIVDMPSGKATVYDLTEAPELSKATETATEPEPKTVYFVDDGEDTHDSLRKFTSLNEAEEVFNYIAYGAGYPNAQLYAATEIKEV